MASNLRSGEQDEPLSEINVTPFVDITLVLLVIFMVTAGIIVHRGVQIELPEAATAEQLRGQITLSLVITKEGMIFLDNQLVPLAELRNIALAAKNENKKVVAMISADKGVVYNTVVKIMDELRKTGVADFALQLDQQKE